MAKSSINFQKVSTHSFKHNSREEKRTAKTVFKEYSHLNECSRSAKEAKQLFDSYYKEAISKVTGRTRRAKKENCLVEAVVNLNADHTLEDVEKLAKKIEKETGFTCLQIAIHKDEGQEQNGKLVRKNHHAHISFFTLDLQTGRQMFRREHLTKAKLSKLQDITAETLNMQRGEKNSKRKRLNHKEYKEHAKQIEKERATQKQLKEEIAQLRAELREANKQLEIKIYTKEDYDKINKLNRELQEAIKAKELTESELKEHIESLRAEFKRTLEKQEEHINILQDFNSDLQAKLSDLEDIKEELEKENESLKQEIEKKDRIINNQSYFIKELMNKLNVKITTMKETLENAFKKIDQLKERQQEREQDKPDWKKQQEYLKEKLERIRQNNQEQQQKRRLFKSR